MRTKKDKEFLLEIHSLSNETHRYEYVLDDAFFAKQADSLIEKGRFDVVLSLQKSETMLVLDFKIEGSCELLCDRSLEAFDYPMSAEGRLIMKYGATFEELSEELYTIPFETTEIDLRTFIYEFVAMNVPFKKIHPRFEDDSDEEFSLIYTSKEENLQDTQAETESSSDEEEVIDPRWEALRKLKR